VEQIAIVQVCSVAGSTTLYVGGFTALGLRGREARCPTVKNVCPCATVGAPEPAPKISSAAESPLKNDGRSCLGAAVLVLAGSEHTVGVLWSLRAALVAMNEGLGVIPMLCHFVTLDPEDVHDGRGSAGIKCGGPWKATQEHDKVPVSDCFDKV
jgi:hypothetical protein